MCTGAEETAEKKTAEEETAVEETAEEEVDWNSEAARAKDAAVAAERLKMLPMPQLALDRDCGCAVSELGGQTGLSESLAAPLAPYQTQSRRPGAHDWHDWYAPQVWPHRRARLAATAIARSWRHF
eukprot:scaffold132785_cov63-Phaeocystis_antarctica.AAC.1